MIERAGMIFRRTVYSINLIREKMRIHWLAMQPDSYSGNIFPGQPCESL
jgi:hypothetical protein